MPTTADPAYKKVRRVASEKVSAQDATSGRIKKFGPRDHLFKPGVRQTTVLNSIMVSKAKRFQEAYSHDAKIRVIQEVEEFPGNFLRETGAGDYAIMKGTELHEKLAVMFNNLSYSIKNHLNRYNDSGSENRFSAIAGSSPESTRKKQGRQASPTMNTNDGDDVSDASDKAVGQTQPERQPRVIAKRRPPSTLASSTNESASKKMRTVTGAQGKKCQCRASV